MDKLSSACYKSNIQTKSNGWSMEVFDDVEPRSYTSGITAMKKKSWKGTVMAIVLNNTSALHGVTSKKSGKRPVLVPPAAVWEPERCPSFALTRDSGMPRVRALEPRDRTQRRTDRIGDSSGPNQSIASQPRRSGSNVGNYVLGAVFGAAVFIGTVWGGLSIDGEVPNASGTSPKAVVSSR